MFDNESSSMAFAHASALGLGKRSRGTGRGRLAGSGGSVVAGGLHVDDQGGIRIGVDCSRSCQRAHQFPAEVGVDGQSWQAVVGGIVTVE